jgi:uncharacterized protein YkwD
MTIDPPRQRIRAANTNRTSRASRAFATVVAAGVVSGGLVAGVGATSAQAATSNASYFVNAINAQRVAHHRARLKVSADMTRAAQRWASAMARSNTLAHNPRLASSVSNWKFLGENVGVGYSAASLEAAFFASPHHRDNMLDSDFTEIGVAVVVVKGKMWVAEEYRRPQHSTASAAHKKKPVNLHVGSRGSLVAVVQRLLHITADGVYGPQTRSAVSSFQRHHHLTVTGRVTASTLAALKR